MAEIAPQLPPVLALGFTWIVWLADAYKADTRAAAVPVDEVDAGQSLRAPVALDIHCEPAVHQLLERAARLAIEISVRFLLSEPTVEGLRPA